MRAPLRLAACAAALAHVLPAQAALVENLTTSVVAMSLGNAVTADPPGIDSVHFNPAGLARLQGDSMQHTAFGASIRARAGFSAPAGFDIGGWKDDPISGTHTGPMRQAMYVPAYGMPGWRLPGVIVPTFGFAWNNPGSPWTFATNSYMAQAISLDRTKDPDDPGRFDGRQIQLQRLVWASPAVGYKYSDTLRFGAAVPIAHSAFVVDTHMRIDHESRVRDRHGGTEAQRVRILVADRRRSPHQPLQLDLAAVEAPRVIRVLGAVKADRLRHIGIGGEGPRRAGIIPGEAEGRHDHAGQAPARHAVGRHVHGLPHRPGMGAADRIVLPAADIEAGRRRKAGAGADRRAERRVLHAVSLQACQPGGIEVHRVDAGRVGRDGIPERHGHHAGGQVFHQRSLRGQNVGKRGGTCRQAKRGSHCCLVRKPAAGSGPPRSSASRW